MSRHEDSTLLRDMLEHACLARDAARDRSRSDLDADRVFRAACERLVEIIGEAASHVTDEMQNAHPEIPWRKMVGTRNILIHGYARIDLDILWNILEIDLPDLVGKLEQVLGK